MIDRNGKELKAGDVVLVPCTVTEVKGGNVTLETFEPSPSINQKTTLILETKQVQKADDPTPAGQTSA